ncbi:hypothetical protein [Geodermatophilus sp. URMC 62]|uniref:hypothetical protein n=1 Tax=Geodermatophilus sp. URMC 62 TaxID=3423414 RepID=UPI00406D084B
MTDARLPERWLLDRRLLRISGDAYRTFTQLLLFAVANRTDGVIDLTDLDLIPCTRREDVPALERMELVEVDGDRLTLVDFALTQTSREQLEAAEAAREAERAADRERKRRKREEARAEPVSPGTSDRTSDRNPNQKHRTGQDRQDRRAAREWGNRWTTPENGHADLAPDERELLAELELERSAAGGSDD